MFKRSASFFYPPLAALTAVLLTALPARAELIRITPLGVTVAQQDATGFTDPVPISGDGFRLTYHGGGSDALIDPIELIIGLPAGPGPATAPSLTSAANSGFTAVNIDLGDSQTRYNGSWDTTTGFAGLFTSAGNVNSPGPNPKVYDFIGFNPTGSDSQNYTNWNGNTGLTGWNLFVYALSFDPNMNHGSWAEFSTNLPIGSYVIGYGCTSLNNSDTACKNPGSAESTPFTFAGLVTKVPEPSSVAMLTFGLAALVSKARRRRS